MKRIRKNLALPNSLKSAGERMAAADGTSMNQFLDFSALRGHGDQAAALAFLSRPGGEVPRSGDEIDG